MPKLTYHQQATKDNTLKLREILTTLPPFMKDYFRALDVAGTSAKTRISYAYDLRVFINFLINTNPLYKSYSPTDFKLKDIEKLEPVDIEEYLEYLKLYSGNDGVEHSNSQRGITRKLSSLRSFYSYYYKHKRIDNDPTLLVASPKKEKNKNIVRMEPNEVAKLLDYVDNLEKELDGRKLTFFQMTKYRDIAILTLLLGTGIRVSECIGLDLNDIDFNNNGLKVVRKGGDQEVVYFGEEVAEALQTYLTNTRNFIIPTEGNEDALFLSIQKKRISVDAVEDLVKKYARAVTPLKNITPHKLRSTYGTTLYQETGDIYLVAEVLGHTDVNTTRAHYSAISETRKRKMANIVKLREWICQYL